MDGQLSQIIMDGLDGARFKRPEKTGAFRIVAGGRSYPVLRMLESGFVLRAEEAPQLRGLVELYEGQAYILMCLVVANAPENGEIVFEYKRATHVTDRPPLDFVAGSDDAYDGASHAGSVF